MDFVWKHSFQTGRAREMPWMAFKKRLCRLVGRVVLHG